MSTAYLGSWGAIALLSLILLALFVYGSIHVRRRYRRAQTALESPRQQVEHASQPPALRDRPEANWPRGNYRFVALDVETATAWRGSICQLGLACVTETGAIETFCTYIDPQCAFDDANVTIYGITERDVRGAPCIEEVLRELNPLLSRHPIVQHSSFDRSAIRAACEDQGISEPDWHWIDSVRIAQAAWPELRGNGGHGLSNLSKTLGIDFIHHDAGHDAKAAAAVVLKAEEATGVSFEFITQSANRQIKRAAPLPAPSGRHSGQVIVFTGDLSISREEAMALAAQHGMTVRNNISKKTTILVASDPNLGTGKLKKANEYISSGLQIRIISEREFLDSLEVPSFRAPRLP